MGLRIVSIRLLGGDFAGSDRIVCVGCRDVALQNVKRVSSGGHFVGNLPN